ncbi:MAG: hypothetical protein ABH870_05215 [bacterium]
MEYIGFTHEVARNIYIGVGVAVLAFIVPFVTTVLRPIKDRVVKQKEQLREEMKASENYIIPSELCILFDRLYDQEHKIEKVEQDVKLAFWYVVVTIFLAMLGIIVSLLQWQIIDIVMFFLFALSVVVSMMFILSSCICYLNDSKK